MAVIAAQIFCPRFALSGAVDVFTPGGLYARQTSPLAGLMVSKVRPLVAVYNHH
jgi:hypothetical protein